MAELQQLDLNSESSSKVCVLKQRNKLKKQTDVFLICLYGSRCRLVWISGDTKLKNFLTEKKCYFIITKLQTPFCLPMEMHLIVLNGNSSGVMQHSGPGPGTLLQPVKWARAWG